MNALELKMNTDLTKALPQSVDFNYEELKEALTERLDHYNNLVITEDTVKEGKEDRAKLNKLRTAIDAKRKDVKKDFLRPYTDFEAKCKELTALIDEPIKSIDGQLDVFEQKRKEKKMAEIKLSYVDIVPPDFQDILPLERVLDKRWLNATTSIKKVREDLIERVKRVNADMLAMNAVEPEYLPAVRAKYIEHLDISEALAFRDAQKAADEAFKKREAEVLAEDMEEVTEPVREQERAPEPETTYERLHVLTMQFQITRSQALLLKQFLVENKISYQRI